LRILWNSIWAVAAPIPQFENSPEFYSEDFEFHGNSRISGILNFDSWWVVTYY
jgi:hypothetical protein